MKICFIAPMGTIHTHKWIEYFANQGHDIYCIGAEKNTGNHPQIKYYSSYEKTNSNIFINFFPLKLIYHTIFGIKLLKKIKPDIVHLHFIGFSSLIPLFIKIKKLIITVWGSDILILPKKIPGFKYIIKKLFNKASYITTDGYNSKDNILKYGINEDKIKMIGFGIDTKIFKKTNFDKQTDIINIISLRSLSKIYDIQTLIKAIPLVVKKYKNIKLDIYGDGPEKENLIKLTNKLEVNNYINFKGKYDNKKLPEYLNESHIYVSTSLSDSGLAGSTGEAMACGLTCIITDNADNSKRIENFKNGFIITNKSYIELSEKIIYFIDNYKQIIIMGDNNINVIKEKNDYYNEMKKMDKIYSTFKG